MDFISALQASEKWGISRRRVAILCEQERIHGAQKIGNAWIIPDDAEKPSDARIKSGKYVRSNKTMDDGDSILK